MLKRVAVWIIALLVVVSLALPALSQNTTAPAQPPLPRVQIVTSAGTMIVEADTRRAPVSAGNFLRYVDQRRLDGALFYRVVKVQPEFGFVQFGMQGNPAKNLPPIRHEPTTQTGILHKDGVLSTPRLAPGTARGEFTIMVGDQPGMDANPTASGDNLGYAAFGRVVEGRDVLVKILDSRIDPAKTDRGAFRGEIPAVPVRILTARRLPAGQ